MLTKKASNIDLHSVLIVETLINNNSGELNEKELLKKIGNKITKKDFQIIINYLEKINKIIFEKDGNIVYIWNPKLSEMCKNRPDITI
jgi:hypothetical protein